VKGRKRTSDSQEKEKPQMKKDIVGISVALTVILTVLLSPVVRVMAGYWVDDCECNHFDHTKINTGIDEYTATGIHAYCSGGYFSSIEYTSQRAMGDQIYTELGPVPSPYHLLNIRYQWVENDVPHLWDITYNTPVPWTYPVNPFGGPYPYYHAQTRVYTDYVYHGEYAASKASCYLPVPYYPGARWWCEGTMATVQP
jgi:hypothetical protein